MTNLPANTTGSDLESYAANLKTKIEMATVLLRSGMAPSHFKSPEAILTAILYGQELGFSPMQSLQSVVVIQGKPTVDAAGLQAIALNAGAKIEEVELTDKVCTLRITRGDTTREFSFSWDDAKTMQLDGKDNWRKMPKDMLYARCVSRGVRRMFADAVRGFYSTEEVRDEVVSQPIATLVQPNGLPMPGIVPADDIPEGKPYRYDLKDLDNGKRATAIKYLEKEGALLDEGDIWISKRRLKRLDAYVVIDMEAA